MLRAHPLYLAPPVALPCSPLQSLALPPSLTFQSRASPAPGTASVEVQVGGRFVHVLRYCHWVVKVVQPGRFEVKGWNTAIWRAFTASKAPLPPIDETQMRMRELALLYLPWHNSPHAGAGKLKLKQRCAVAGCRRRDRGKRSRRTRYCCVLRCVYGSLGCIAGAHPLHHNTPTCPQTPPFLMPCRLFLVPRQASLQPLSVFRPSFDCHSILSTDGLSHLST